VNDYKKLQLIYEGGGMSVSEPGNPKYAPDPRNSGLHTYPSQLDFNKGSNAGIAGIAGIAGRIEAEESKITGNISTELVIDKLSDLLDRANKEGMHYAIYALGNLKEFILKNNKPK